MVTQHQKASFFNILMMLCTLLAPVLYIASPSSLASAVDDTDTIDKTKKFHFGVLKSDYNSSRSRGSSLNIDILEDFGSTLGVDYNITEYDSISSLEEAIQNGKLDAALSNQGIFNAMSAITHLYTTEPVYTELRIIFLSDNTKYDGNISLSQQRWICVKNSIACDLIQSKGYSNIQLSNSYEEMFKTLKNGGADATITTPISLLTNLSNKDLSRGLTIFDIGLGLNKKTIATSDEKLALALNGLIKDIKSDSTDGNFKSLKIFSFSETSYLKLLKFPNVKTEVRYSLPEGLFPISYKNNRSSKMGGYVREFLEDIEDVSIVKFTYVPSDGRNIDLMLSQGVIDLIPVYFSNKLDDHGFLVTKPYHGLDLIKITLEGNENNATVGIPMIFDSIRKPSESTVLFTSYFETIRALEQGVIGSAIVDSDLIKQDISEKTVFIDNSLTPIGVTIAMATRKNNENLLEYLSTILSGYSQVYFDRLKGNETLPEVQYGVDEKTLLRYVLIIVTFLLIVSIVVIIRIRMLNKLVIDSSNEVKTTKTVMASRSEFLAIVSHELRTPISAMIGLLELLISRVSEKEDKLLIRNATISAEKLERHVNDILDFSKIEAGKLQLESRTANIYEELSVVFRPFDAQAKKKHIDFIIKWEETSYLLFDIDMFRVGQIATNILSNAMKFTDEGRIVVSVNAEQDGINVTVKDTGCGIEKSKLSQMFQPYVQANSSISRKYGGTGLGMTIVANLVKLMNGTIEIESEPDHGTKVSFYIPATGNKLDKYEHATIHLPIANKKELAWAKVLGLTITCDTISEPEANNNFYLDGFFQLLENKENTTGSVGTKNIGKLQGNALVAEDDPINRMLMKRQLVELGFDVTLSKNGYEASTK
nr:ATP-binding protein [Enterovibrio nigricans]